MTTTFEDNQSGISNPPLDRSSARWSDEITASYGDESRKVDPVELIPDIPARHRPSRANSQVISPHQCFPNRWVEVSARQHEFDRRNGKLRDMSAPELDERLLVTTSARPTPVLTRFDGIPVGPWESRNESDLLVAQLIDAGVAAADDQTPKPTRVAEGSLKDQSTPKAGTQQMATAQVQLSSYRFSLVCQSLDGHIAIASRALGTAAAELVIEHDPVSELRKIGDRTHQVMGAAGAPVQAQHRTSLVLAQFLVEEAVTLGPDETGPKLESHSWLDVLSPIKHKGRTSCSPRGGYPPSRTFKERTGGTRTKGQCPPAAGFPSNGPRAFILRWAGLSADFAARPWPEE